MGNDTKNETGCSYVSMFGKTILATRCTAKVQHLASSNINLTFQFFEPSCICGHFKILYT